MAARETDPKPTADQQPFVVTDFTMGMGLSNLKERAVEVHLALAALEKEALSPGANPQVVFYEGSDYERLWTAHGLLWLRPLQGEWYWVSEPIALATIVERWPQYRDYCLTRTRWAIDYCDREHRDCVLDGCEGDAYFWGTNRERLKHELELAETSGLPPASRKR
jgi:hypothetical protein